LVAGGAGGVDVGGVGLPRLTSLLLVVGIGILNRTLGFVAMGRSDAGSLGSVTMRLGSVVIGSKSLVASGAVLFGSSWISCSLEVSSSDSGSTIAGGRRFQSGL
jgi:hypothetical protein